MQTNKMVLSAMFAALTVIGGLLAVPIGAVPITFQVLFCLLSGALLGARYGALAQLVYVLLGAIGLPVFAGGKGGLGVLAGPTGGYLFGFILAAFIIGKLTEKREPELVGTVIAMLVGLVIIYIIGTTQLAFVLKFTPEKAIAVGVAPFIALDLMKLAIAAAVAVGSKKALKAANLLPE